VAELADEGFNAEASPDGRLVFSKHETRRFPEPEEILRALRAL
jgi:hypothetical protein